MAVTFESIQSNSVTDAALVITKPVDLAVGDLMVAGISFSDDFSGSGGINTPAGWTLQDTTSTGTPNEVMAVFTKEAESADVAASNFTFTRSGADTTYHLVGHILRVTDFGSIDNVSGDVDSNLSTTVTTTGFTPSIASTLFIGFLLNVSAGTVTNTSIALATDNPTWTEQAETTQSDTSRTSTLSAYTATRTETTATGTITGTTGSSPAKHLIVLNLTSKINGSVSQEVYVNAYAFNPINPTATVDGIVDTPTLAAEDDTAPIVWTNENKDSTIWTNDDL